MPLTQCPSILDRLRDGQLLPRLGPAGTVEGRVRVLFSSGSLVPSPGPGSCSSSVQSLSPLLLECAWALRALGFLRRRPLTAAATLSRREPHAYLGGASATTSGCLGRS